MSPKPQPIDIEAQDPWVSLRKQLRISGDDAVRLEYARLWRAHRELDPLRALLIEQQVEIASLAGGIDHPEWSTLNREIARTLRQVEAAFTPSWFGEEVTGAIFHRGFIEQVTVPISFLLEPRGRRQLFECAPVMHLDITCIEDPRELGLFCITNEFKNLHSLSLDAQNLDDDAVLKLIAAAGRNLRWLSLAHNRITQRGATALAEAYREGALPGLRFVNLEGNPFDPADRFETDRGVVIRHRTSPAAIRLEGSFGVLPWLHRHVAGGRIATPDRLSASVQ